MLGERRVHVEFACFSGTGRSAGVERVEHMGAPFFRTRINVENSDSKLWALLGSLVCLRQTRRSDIEAATLAVVGSALMWQSEVPPLGETSRLHSKRPSMESNGLVFRRHARQSGRQRSAAERREWRISPKSERSDQLRHKSQKATLCLTGTSPSVTSCNATMTNTRQARLKNLGEVEQTVMDYLWTRGPSSAEACREALASSRPMKETVCPTHETEGRTFIYKASDARQNVAVRAVKGIIDRFCGGSAEQLVLGMVDNAVLNRKQLERLARKIAEKEEEKT